MIVERLDRLSLHILFTPAEVEFAEREAKENDISVEEMIEVIFGMWLVGGLSDLIGKE